ncbi:MAG: phosphoribosylglycinamide formyltransferase [Gemmatimonadetes bacterium]|nr:phosphoribosylglycinamide formyltransferase [Gemmatimonadota bacterium]MBT6146019.1 phosphoribosylglycinamide formyltransferase [Gemmatimonadota bacterium]MBT7863824.1 phosphoribosylglycinamide formyltransferase [Gemmatimonadota bacterium]
MNEARLRLGFLASGGGTNLQAILDACGNGQLHGDPRIVISNNSKAGALTRAHALGIDTGHLSGHTHPDPAQLDEAVCSMLQTHDVEVVCLVGYMKKLGPRTLSVYRRRILNVHPALLPRHGGQGFYGDRVHAAVLAAGDEVSGVTIHVVDEEYDHGPVVDQETVPVLPGDTVETLAARVLTLEHALFPRTLQKIAIGQIDLDALG